MAISTEDFLAFCNKLGIDKATLASAAQPERAPLGAPDPRYRLDLAVFDEKVRLRLYEDGNELVYAYAKRQGEGMYNLVQAISYAAHMLMKITEQRELARMPATRDRYAEEDL